MVNKTKIEKARDVMQGASTGLAVAIAFFNVALLLVQLVKTVSEDESSPLKTEAEE